MQKNRRSQMSVSEWMTTKEEQVPCLTGLIEHVNGAQANVNHCITVMLVHLDCESRGAVLSHSISCIKAIH